MATYKMAAKVWQVDELSFWQLTLACQTLATFCQEKWQPILACQTLARKMATYFGMPNFGKKNGNLFRHAKLWQLNFGIFQ